MPTSLRARAVFPVDRPPIENGVVTIDGERIVFVGENFPGGGRLRNLGEVALLPGLVNSHTHLEFSDLARPLGTPGMPLPAWIRLAIAERGRNARSPNHAIAAGLRESAECGVTTIGEIATTDARIYRSELPLDVTWLAEVIGFSRARAASALSAVTERLEECELLLSTNRIQLGLSPHAPYTVSPDLLGRLVELARQRNLPVAMHLAESIEELELLASGAGPFQQLLEERSMWDPTAIPHGSLPIDYLRQLADVPRALVIHGNYLEPTDHAFLAEHADRMSVIYCPRTHAYFRHSSYPLAEMLSRGVHVAVGTDSRASNPDLSVWRELRYVTRAHPNVAPDAILRMGTLAGARALGRVNECGSITPGKLANLIVVPLSPDVAIEPDELLASLFAAAVPAAAWIRGQEIRPAI